MRGQTSVVRLAAILSALLLLGTAVTPAAAADCPQRFRISFADGTGTCLTAHALANDDVVGQFGVDLRRVVPPNGTYAVAATPALPQCKRAVGLGTTEGTPADSTPRSEKALLDCRLRARGAKEECRCKVVLVDGRSTLTRAEFARYADPTPATAAAPAAVPGNPSATTPSTAATTPAQGAVAAPNAPTAATAALPPGPTASRAATTERRAEGGSTTADDIAALRLQVEALQRAQGSPRAQAGASAEPARKAQRARALVIGNSRYVHLGTLPNPRRDAEAIAAKLRSYGIEVDLALDTDRPGLVQALSAFQTRASGYDVNILFYAGHGLQMAGINYIVPVDMNPEGATVGAVKLNGVSLDDALDYLPATTRVVFLDACRDNPISRSLRSTRSGAGVGLAPVSSVSGTLLSYATRDGSVAEDGTGKNSPYTTALLQHLDAEEDIALVLRRVRQEVLRATGQRQEPWEYG